MSFLRSSQRDFIVTHLNPGNTDTQTMYVPFSPGKPSEPILPASPGRPSFPGRPNSPGPPGSPGSPLGADRGVSPFRPGSP